MSPLRRYLPVFTVAVAVAALYLYKLDGVGALGPDEPRYAAIGQAIAHGGDYITPHLWGAPWFEKPPLLYWLTALGTLCGLNVDLAGRLPVTLLSLAFLATTFALLKREFGAQSAGVSVAMLSTCAGWFAYSQLCLTDIPLAVFFSLAAFLCLPLTREKGTAKRYLAIGACLGLATLAKGLVPLALALPWFWFLRARWRHWWLTLVACCAVALPWYVAVYVKNGYPFVEEFFIRHHFERLYSPTLQHVQPWYYYLPVLLAGLFPWTPTLFLFKRSELDPRRRFLLATTVWGVLFFSISLNKLPGYLMPVLPSLFALLGSHYETRMVSRTPRSLLFACAVFIGCIPLLARVLPASLAGGRISLASFGTLNRTALFYMLVPLVAVFLARRAWVGPVLLLSLAAGGLYLKTVADGTLDTRVSSRGLWTQIKTHDALLCDGGMNRDWNYGLSFYAGRQIPNCDGRTPAYVLRSKGHDVPTISEQR